jgi:hypothetical protein
MQITTPLVETAADSHPAASKPEPRPRVTPRALAREPLAHFVLLGGLLFGLDHLLNAKTDRAHTIVVGAAADREAIETFKASRGHEPNAEELTALRRVWLDNEILYREGLALGVDKGDDAIRERVIFKALSVVDSNVKLPQPDENTLRAWFQSHREKYDEPERYDFEEAALSGDPPEATARAFVDELNGGTPGDAKAGLRVFKGRPRANVEQSYGPDVAKLLAASKPGVWQVVSTKDGFRALRLDAMIPAKPARFAALRGMVSQDWTDATAAQQRTDAVRALGQKYSMKYEQEP